MLCGLANTPWTSFYQGSIRINIDREYCIDLGFRTWSVYDYNEKNWPYILITFLTWNYNYTTTDSFYLFLYSALSLVSQLGPVKSESIKARVNEELQIIFVLWEQNRTEENRQRHRTIRGRDRGFVFLSLYRRHCSSQRKKTARIEEKNSSREK